MSQRCGWCITGDHANCVVVLEFGSTARSRSKRHPSGNSPYVSPYFWNCSCRCAETKTKCVKCHRLGVELVNNRCVDVASCAAVPVETRKMPRYLKEYS